MSKVQCLFLEADLSQAEDRVVKALSGHPRAIELALKHPSEFDAHSHSAAAIFSVVRGKSIDPAEVTKQQRNIGKRVRHAKNYGMRAGKLQEVFLKEDGSFIPLNECEDLLAAVDVVEPWIDKYQRETRLQVLNYKRLENSWGRSIDFRDERIDDSLFRRAYAFVPQSEVGDLLKQWGWRMLFEHLKAEGMRSHINLQVHDSLLISVTRDEVYDVATFLDLTMSNERIYGKYKVELGIPVEFALGPNWGKKGRTEWKRLPSQAELEAEFDRLMEGRMREAA